jgi:hypothetical protein
MSFGRKGHLDHHRVNKSAAHDGLGTMCSRDLVAVAVCREETTTVLWQQCSARLRHHHRDVVAATAEIPIENARDDAGVPSGEPRIGGQIPVRRQAI